MRVQTGAYGGEVQYGWDVRVVKYLRDELRREVVQRWWWTSE